MSVLQNFLYSSYDKISNYLYLGNYNAAQDEQFIKNNDIKLVINASKDLKIPEFINKKLLMEVTGLKQFSNRSLSIKLTQYQLI